jgi:hypothetical protein
VSITKQYQYYIQTHTEMNNAENRKSLPGVQETSI